MSNSGPVECQSLPSAFVISSNSFIFPSRQTADLTRLLEYLPSIPFHFSRVWLCRRWILLHLFRLFLSSYLGQTSYKNAPPNRGKPQKCSQCALALRCNAMQRGTQHWQHYNERKMQFWREGNIKLLDAMTKAEGKLWHLTGPELLIELMMMMIMN